MSISNADQEKLAKLHELSDRQRQVLKLSCQKMSQDKIAEELKIKKNTVKKHMQNIKIKLRISGIPDGGTVVEKEDVDAREYLLLEYCHLLPLLEASELGVEESVELLVSAEVEGEVDDEIEESEVNTQKSIDSVTPQGTAQAFAQQTVNESDSNTLSAEPEIIPASETSHKSSSPLWTVIASLGGAGIVLLTMIILLLFFRGGIGGFVAMPTNTPTSTPSSTNTPTPLPTNTSTTTLTDTPTLTPVPSTIACGQSTIVSNIFPRLTGQQSFLGPYENPAFADYFTCEGVTDPDSVRSDPGVLRIVYQNTGNRNDFGYFGIGLNAFDASQFSELCLLVYASNPHQAFWLKMKDIHQNEGQVEVNVDVPNNWLPQCVDLEKYASQGIDLSQLENISLGFDPLLGSAELWFDDFEFKD